MTNSMQIPRIFSTMLFFTLRLDRDLEEAEDQFQMSLRAHLENMDRLIDLQDTRLLALEQEFEKELHTLENEFGTEKEAIAKQHSQEASSPTTPL